MKFLVYKLLNLKIMENLMVLAFLILTLILTIVSLSMPEEQKSHNRLMNNISKDDVKDKFNQLKRASTRLKTQAH